jgi:hypothetical protein
LDGERGKGWRGFRFAVHFKFSPEQRAANGMNWRHHQKKRRNEND